ncbi:MOSC domain-containing protein [Pontibacillus yanchengensis]|uniref:MOSC domain-containing protein n=2 Tax=Pontibacillus yanchengensis TaxID=462910 RepID=A0ACC7VJE0_9BACI|nr:MOSC domain-containing protein [Pontibacillus yanchengensis]MYL34890.1 MOSC domain-containing protein [Pontibacillus yanchengensis]MYL54735.1 MOSC domain-containing protein [Pontibacillus yanchengensis]
MEDDFRIISMHVGRPENVVRNGEELYTSFLKTPTTDQIALSSQGLEGDGQAVTKFHGGVEKAVCVYPYQHYAYWEQHLDKKMEFPSFGENLTVDGLHEENVFIGDVFQWGNAKLQVVQPRKPCERIAFVHQVKNLTKKVVQTGYTGFYMSVLEEGEVSANDRFDRIQTDPNAVSVAYVNQIKLKDRHNIDGIRNILQVDGLADELRRGLQERLDKLEEKI